jgi:ABC-type sugar transport system permease subunit
MHQDQSVVTKTLATPRRQPDDTDVVMKYQRKFVFPVAMIAPAVALIGILMYYTMFGTFIESLYTTSFINPDLNLSALSFIPSSFHEISSGKSFKTLWHGRLGSHPVAKPVWFSCSLVAQRKITRAGADALASAFTLGIYYRELSLPSCGALCTTLNWV